MESLQQVRDLQGAGGVKPLDTGKVDGCYLTSAARWVLELNEIGYGVHRPSAAGLQDHPAVSVDRLQPGAGRGRCEVRHRVIGRKPYLPVNAMKRRRPLFQGL
ncbi:MAG TPA: hypothetical protein VJ890_17725 [Vineibacter sp.]|nr:hypothetical protein [Vineibacter sp.]